jgi:hypothetical protein
MGSKDVIETKEAAKILTNRATALHLPLPGSQAYANRSPMASTAEKTHQQVSGVIDEDD